MRFCLKFEMDRCKGCGLCIPFCRDGLIAFDLGYLNRRGVHPAMIAEPERCIGCMNCAIMCPDGVISIERAGED